ncbi:hypothetical protein [Qipengyuania marisflavi]|uniref:Uncharacterized protein n=1 Tax=Qipengyuania marisflavi TaxID=2486356 RepID=A0A5S3P8E2_9SPHN|nr:hypothetical protein [Qipengyuania marisflavi]TMM49698.1 hypothetical protein FEV51_00360 [Qipengyuania marisflavi]
MADYAVEFQPMHDTENCGVSVLLAGAVKAGMFGVCEYSIERVSEEDCAPKAGQKADLWLLDKGRGYGFEFKQYCAHKPNNRDLGGQMHLAKLAAKTLPDEQDRVFGGVIAPVFPDDLEEELIEFAQYVDYPVQLNSAAGWSAFIFFDEVR